MAITRRELDGKKCEAPGCTKCGQLFLHAACHMGGGLEVEYDGQGSLHVRCHVCKKPVVSIVVAEGASEWR